MTAWRRNSSASMRSGLELWSLSALSRPWDRERMREVRVTRLRTDWVWGGCVSTTEQQESRSNSNASYRHEKLRLGGQTTGGGGCEDTEAMERGDTRLRRFLLQLWNTRIGATKRPWLALIVGGEGCYLAAAAKWTKEGGLRADRHTQRMAARARRCVLPVAPQPSRS